MDQATLVETQIQDGQRLLDRLTREGVAVTAACWVKESDSGDWYLYLATPLVGEDGATRAAYHQVNTVIRAMQTEGVWIELEKKVIAPHDPIARDVVAYRDLRPTRTGMWFRGSRLGELAVEAAYIYPTTPHPEEAVEVPLR